MTDHLNPLEFGVFVTPDADGWIPSAPGALPATPAGTSVAGHAPDECAAVQAGVSLLGRAWAGAVLWALIEGAERFVEIREWVPGVSDAVLSSRLKDLAEHGLVERIVEPGPPVRVRYVATAAGLDARGVLESLRDYVRRQPGVFVAAGRGATD